MAGNSQFPSALDSLPTGHVDNVDEKILASVINDMADAINKIEATLGINPHQGNVGTGVFADLVSRLNALDTPSLKSITPPYTIIKSDMGVILNAANTTDQNITIPPSSSVAFPVGALIQVRVGAAGAVTFVGGAGVTLQARGGAVKSAGQFALIQALHTSGDFWTISGDVV
jgi:hypothetical protein